MQLTNAAVNIPYLSNSIALWLSITPADLFLYVFLPPLLLDSAVRIDYFVFKKVHDQGLWPRSHPTLRWIVWSGTLFSSVSWRLLCE